MKAPERVRVAMAGGVPDRVPFMPKIWFDLAARLLRVDLLELASDPEEACLAIPRAARELGLDGARLFHLPRRRLARAADGRAVEFDGAGRELGRVDEAGGLSTQHSGGRGVALDDPEFSAWPQFRSAEEPFVASLADVERLAVPDEAFWESSGAAARTRRALREFGGDLALAGDLGTATVSFCAAMRGIERTMYDLIDEPRLVHALMDKGVEIALAKARLNLAAGLRILRLNDSAGTMSLISPATWREFVLPRFRLIVSEVRRMAPEALVYCHVCGDLRPIAADLAASGLDCIGPLDPLGGSTPDAVRSLAGPKVALMGGIDTLSFLSDDPADVAREARLRIEQGGALGAFVLGSGCVVPRDARRAALEAARDAARDARYENGRLAPPGGGKEST